MHDTKIRNESLRKLYDQGVSTGGDRPHLKLAPIAIQQH